MQYKITVIDKSDDALVWTEYFDNQIDAFKGFVIMQKQTFNPDYFEFKVTNID